MELISICVGLPREVMVTQPRFPCFKLNLKFGRDDMVRRFLDRRLSGIYFSVVSDRLLKDSKRHSEKYADEPLKSPNV